MSKEFKKINLKEIKDPTFLRTLNNKELTFLCSEIREDIINSCNKNGGHLSSNLGVVEAVVALHKTFDFSKDKLLFDVGHQCYTHKILTGRSLENLRKKNGVAGFPKINESKYDCFEGGHSSNSISNAIGMAIARDLNKESYDIVSFIGDASLSNGLAFEALNDLNLTKHKIIIILNENGMSISKNVGKTSMLFSKISTSGLYSKTKLILKRLSTKNKFLSKFYEKLYSFKNMLKRILLHKNIFTDLGLVYYGVVDGHNIKKLEKAFNKAKKCTKSCLIHIKTIKGYGYVPAQADEDGYYHSVSANSLNDDFNTVEIKASYDNVFNKKIENALQNNNNNNNKLVLLCPGTLVGAHLIDIRNKYPNRVFDTGITEEHTISMAAGLALNGFHPIVSIYSTFLQRAFDEVSHDVARCNLDMTLLINRAGLVGQDGDTHNGLYDESFLMNTPNTTVCMPSSVQIAEELFDESLNKHGVFGIRFPNNKVFDDPNYTKIGYGNWIFEKKVPSDKVIISFGPVLHPLKRNLENINIDIVNAVYQKPIDKKLLSSLLSYKKIIVYNIYGTKNGFNDVIADFLLENNYTGEFISLAVKDNFVPTQTIKEAILSQNLDIESLIKII
jgi:1-deoxy-D-xylulose-5-phosphate synthase